MTLKEMIKNITVTITIYALFLITASVIVYLFQNDTIKLILQFISIPMTFITIIKTYKNVKLRFKETKYKWPLLNTILFVGGIYYIIFPDSLFTWVAAILLAYYTGKKFYYHKYDKIRVP